MIRGIMRTAAHFALLVLFVPILSSCPRKPPLEMKYDDGTSDGYQSIAGGGHAVKFQLPGGYKELTSVSIYGMRYGRPGDSNMYRIHILDVSMHEIKRIDGSYQDFQYAQEGWRLFPLNPPVKVPRTFWVCFVFDPGRTHGVYVHYDRSAQGNSRMGMPPDLNVDPGYNWMIRCNVR